MQKGEHSLSLTTWLLNKRFFLRRNIPWFTSSSSQQNEASPSPMHKSKPMQMSSSSEERGRSSTLTKIKLVINGFSAFSIGIMTSFKLTGARISTPSELKHSTLPMSNTGLTYWMNISPKRPSALKIFMEWMKRGFL
ncbi:hypothetical protein PAXINDRAFT_138590, partial [Paxillus involutus ATCC 200175]